jgi:hypothetical protein
VTAPVDQAENTAMMNQYGVQRRVAPGENGERWRLRTINVPVDDALTATRRALLVVLRSGIC